MTAHSEVIHLAFVEANLPQKTASSSLVLGWAASMDGRSAFARMLYEVKAFYGFEWTPFLP